MLGAEKPSRIRGGARFGGRRGLESYAGDVVRYVVARAPCRVIVTAPPVRPDAAADGDSDPPVRPAAGAGIVDEGLAASLRLARPL